MDNNDIQSTEVKTGDSNKYRLPALLLAISFGGFGAHQFYVGRKGKGMLYIALSMTLMGLILSSLISLGMTVAQLSTTTSSDHNFIKIKEIINTVDIRLSIFLLSVATMVLISLVFTDIIRICAGCFTDENNDKLTDWVISVADNDISVSRKSYITAWLLWLFFGFLFAHRFYTNRWLFPVTIMVLYAFFWVFFVTTAIIAAVAGNMIDSGSLLIATSIGLLSIMTTFILGLVLYIKDGLQLMSGTFKDKQQLFVQRVS